MNDKYICFIFFIICLPLWTMAQIDNIKQTPIKQLKNTHVEVTNALPINTRSLEFSPIFYQNGLVFLKTSENTKKIDSNIGTSFFELAYTELNGHGIPGFPQPFSNALHSNHHEGPVAFNFTEDIIYYTRNSEERGIHGKYSMKIYEARKGMDDWEEGVALPFNSNDYAVMHPSFSANGNRLYFTSDMPGGYGGMDLYYVEKAGDSWGEPVNLGASINTNQHEAFPFIHESGILFFASEGHQGFGGFDIFAVNTLERSISEIIHFGKPFNSPQADFGLIVNPTETQGYFTSSRIGGIGQDDIYLFSIPEGLFTEMKTITIKKIK